MSEAAPLVVCLGEILWDLLPSGPALGGAPANVAIHGRRLGARTALISGIGDDPRGRRARGELERLGVDHRAVAVVSERLTGTVSITLGRDGEPDYCIEAPAAWDFIPTSAEAFRLIEAADALCFGTLAQRNAVSAGTITALIDAAPARSLRVFDVNLRHPWIAPDVIVSLLERSQVVKLNQAELETLSQILDLRGSEGERLERLAARYRLRIVALTRGRSGCHLYGDGQHAKHDGFPVDAVVDSVGAGDAFTAALILGSLRGSTLAATAESANHIASQVCRQSGASVPISELS